MERKTNKAHREFDLGLASDTFAKVEEELTGEQITSPHDLYSVERLRDDLALRKGTAFTTDVFVLGIGSPHARHLTKISGLPYWPKNRTWPTGDNGEPYQFLAQFCFADSRDLVGDLPGDLLLLFVPQDDEEWLWEPDLMRFEWVTVEDQELILSLPDGVEPFSGSEWYGVVHRSSDYPEMGEKTDTLEVRQPYNLPVLNGTKIGGVPHGIQSDAEYEVDSETGLPVLIGESDGETAGRRFLCQLASIQAAPNVPFPWTNQKKKLTLDFDETGIYGESNECMFGDMGSIYVFIESSGKCVATSESY